MGTIHKTALVLTIIGALNWGLAGLFRFDVVAEMASGTLARIIYIIIGISGLINLGLLFDDWRKHDEVIIQAQEDV